MKTTKQKITVYTQAYKYDWQNDFTISNQFFKDKTDDNKIVIDLCEQEVEIDMPDLDVKALTQEHVNQLQEQIEQEKQNSFMKVKRLEDKVKMLLCIEGS